MKTEWILLEWDLPRLKMLKAERSGESWTVRAFRDCQVPELLCKPSEVRGLAEWIRQEFPEFRFEAADGASAIQAGVIFPRDRLAMRQLDLPALSSEELPTVVPLQLSYALTARLEDLVVDYLPEIQQPDGSGVQVLATALPTTQLQMLHQLAAGLHVSLKFVGLSSCMLQELLQKVNPDLAESDCAVAVCGSQDRLEAIALEKQKEVASSYRRRSSGSPVSGQELAAEVRRLLAGTSRDIASQPYQLLLFSETNGVEASEQHSLLLAQEFSKLAGRPVFAPDWDVLSQRITFADQAEGWQFSAFVEKNLLTLLGGMLSVSRNKVPHINFVEPRRPGVVKDLRRQRMILGTAAALLVLGGAYWAWSSKLSGLDSEIDSTRDKIIAADEFLNQQRGVLRATSSIEEYRNRSLHGTFHLGDLMEAMPDRTELLINSWRAIPLSGKTHTRIQAKGVATSRQQVEQLAEKLDQAGLVVRSPVIRPVDGAQVYRYEFDLDYEIPAPVAKKT